MIAILKEHTNKFRDSPVPNKFWGSQMPNFQNDMPGIGTAQILVDWTKETHS